MSDSSRVYAIHSDEECDRLERQASLSGLDDHLRHLRIPLGAKILDAGCGSGSMTRLIARAEPGASVIGVDVRPHYIDYARKKAAQEGLLNVTFMQGDVFSLPFEQPSFDVVWTKYLLQWLKEPKKALAEFKRVTLPGGFIVSCDFDGFVVEHFPIERTFEEKLRSVMSSLVDTQMGRKVAPYMMELGLQGVTIEIEKDRVFTVVGAIDEERRRNWAIQWSAALPHIVSQFPSEIDAREFVNRFMAIHDDPKTSSITTMIVSSGMVPKETRNA